MHPQAPNTQTFLPACLLPTACDYNGLDCFDPLEEIRTYSTDDQVYDNVALSALAQWQ
jgi:hypothetical protein